VKIVFIGLRGFPDVQGGVETHCENLCPLLVNLGFDVEVIVRSPYVSKNALEPWKGVKFRRVWSPKSKSLEAMIHTFLSVLLCGIVIRPDIVHVQAIGPSIWVPFARMLGLKVVVTHHGPDYDRQKWGRLARSVLLLGERFGMKYSHARIVISKVIQDLVWSKYSKKSVVIHNAVSLPMAVKNQDMLSAFNLTKEKYIVNVSRLVPEKRHHDLIEAFDKLDINDWKLVLVGGSDHPDEYEQKLLERIERTQNVIATGFQKGESLAQLYQYAGIFILPSSHEGHPISLLEALSYGLPVISSNIPANLEVGLDQKSYFNLGSVDELSDMLVEHIDRIQTHNRETTRKWVFDKYSWPVAARMTGEIYDRLYQ